MRQDGLLRSLEVGLTLGPCSAVVRHAERPPIPEGSWGDELAIRPEGRRASHSLGRALGRRLGVLVSSPVLRCVQTAQQIGLGANGDETAVREDQRLGAPGAHIERVEELGTLFMDRSAPEIVADLLSGAHIPGLRPPREVVAALVGLARELPRKPGTVDLCVTHDVVVATLLGGLGQLSPERVHEDWPGFLDGVVVAWSGDAPSFVWRGEVIA